MNTLSPNLAQPNPGQQTADSLASVKEAYRGLAGFVESVGKMGFRWFLIVLLSVSLFLPVLVIVALLLRRVKKATRALWESVAFLDERIAAAKACSGNGGSVYQALGFDGLSPQGYASLKEGQDLWLSLEQEIKELGQVEQARLPGWLAFLLRPFGNFYVAFRTYNERFTEVLRLFDQSSPDGQYLTKVSESELWRRRNKAYEYFI